MSYPATETVTVSYAITITFQPGESFQTIAVAIPAGQRSDDTRGFSVTLTDPANADLDPASASATGRIIGNNDHSLDAPAIDFNALGVPSVTLAGGYHVDSHTALTDDWIDELLASGNSNTGTFTGDINGDWSYVQSYDATNSQPAGDDPEDDGADPGLLESMIAALGPVTESGLDDSLTFTFTATGGTLGSSFTLAVTGGRNNEDEDSNYDRQNLNYTLTVDADAGGNIVNTSVTGTATSSYLYVISNAALDIEGEGDAGDGGDGTTTSSGSDDPNANTYSITLSGNSTVTFLNTGIDFSSFDSSTYSFNYTSTVPIDPLVIDLDPEGADGEGDSPADPPPAGDPSEATLTLSGSDTQTLTVSGSLTDTGSLQNYSSTDTWDDTQSIVYTSSFTYSAGELTGSITDNFSDAYHDTGSLTSTFSLVPAVNWTLSGTANSHDYGNSLYIDTWSAPYSVDDETTDLTGTTSGFTKVNSNYDNSIDFEIALDDSESAPEDSYVWNVIGGSILDSFNFTDTTSYNGSGTYSTTAGVGQADEGSQEDLETPISGSITLSGTSTDKYWETYDGTINQDGEVDWTTAEIGTQFDASDTFHRDADGVISGSMTGTITLVDDSFVSSHQLLTIDLIPDQPVITGESNSTDQSSSSYVQTATGSRTIDDLTGTQHANISDVSSNNSFVGLTWEDSIENDEGEAVGGWVLDSTDVTASVDSTVDLGYDVSGTMTQENLSGDATQASFHLITANLTLTVSKPIGGELTSSFSTSQGATDSFTSSHNLSGSFSDQYDSIDVTVTGTQYDNSNTQQLTTSNSSIAIEDDGAPVITASFTSNNFDHSDTGRDGTSDYTRSDEDATFTGEASLSDQSILNVDFFLLMTLGSDGQWQIGDSDPLADPRASVSSLYAMSKVDNHFNGTGTVAPTGNASGEGASIAWTGTASEGSSVFVLSTVNTSSVPSIADDPDAGDGGTGDDPTDETSEEDATLPGLDWATTGTSSDTFHFTSNFSRSASGVYTDGNMSGTATQSITINSHANRTSNSELSEDDDGEWAVTDGSGDSGSLYDSMFSMDATGATTDGLLSGTATIGQFSYDHDSTNRIDTYDTGADDWTSTGTRTTTANSTSNNGFDVSGDEASTAGGVPITATRTLTLDYDSSFDQATTQTLVLRDGDSENGDGESGADSDAYEWAISEGTRHSESGSTLTNALAGTGTDSKQLGEITLDYTLQRDDSTTTDNETKLSYVFDTASGLWTGGGYQSEILDVDNSDTAHAMKIYTISNPDGGGGGQASHDRILTNTVHYDNKTAIDTAPITMNLPELSGTYTSTNTLSNSVRNQSGITIASDAGADAPALGGVTTLLLTHYGYSQTYDMDRPAGETQWTDSGSMTTENSTTNNFDSNLAGAWASPGGGGIGPITGPMSSTVVNHNTDSVVSSGPLNDQGGYDLTTIVTSSYDHQNISSYSGSGNYDTIDHDVPISGLMQISRNDTVINTQNLTTTTAPDGTKTVVGNGRSENTHNSTRSANGGGSVSEHTTWQTGPVNDPNQAPWSGSTTHDYWNVRTVIQSYDRAANYSTVDTYGVIGNYYVLLQHDDNSYFFDNNDSTVDVMTRNKTSSLFTRPNGNATEESKSEADSSTHKVSVIHNTSTKTDNKTEDTADPSNNSAERSGERTESNKQTTDNESSSRYSTTNSSQGSDTYYEQVDDYHSVDEVNGEHTVGDEPADDEGSTTHSGSLGGASTYRNSPNDPFTVYPVVDPQADPTYEETVEDDDDNPPSVPQPHQALESSTPPLTNAGPSASAPIENPHAATDQALLQLTGDDAEHSSPNASTTDKPDVIILQYIEAAEGNGGGLTAHLPDGLTPFPTPVYSPEGQKTLLPISLSQSEQSVYDSYFGHRNNSLGLLVPLNIFGFRNFQTPAISPYISKPQPSLTINFEYGDGLFDPINPWSREFGPWWGGGYQNLLNDHSMTLPSQNMPKQWHYAAEILRDFYPDDLGVVNIVGHGSTASAGPFSDETIDKGGPAEFLAALSAKRPDKVILRTCWSGSDKELLQNLANVLGCEVQAGDGWYGGINWGDWWSAMPGDGGVSPIKRW